MIDKSILKRVIKKRKSSSHKGDFGRVLVIGGSIDYVGAAALAGLSALAVLRSGADLVKIAAPEKVAWAINCISPDLITSKLKGDFLSLKNYEQIKKLIDKNEVILIGPGIGIRDETKKLIKKIIKNNKNKLKVVDADAIKMIDLNEIDNAIITPHKKEFEILLGNSKLSQKNFQKKLRNNVVLLKGSIDYIFSKNKREANKTGNPGMTVGGTGDVLAGLCAGFLAQSRNLFDSACAAAYVCGKAGDNLEKRMGYGFIASDLIGEICAVTNTQN